MLAQTSNQHFLCMQAYPASADATHRPTCKHVIQCSVLLNVQARPAAHRCARHRERDITMIQRRVDGCYHSIQRTNIRTLDVDHRMQSKETLSTGVGDTRVTGSNISTMRYACHRTFVNMTSTFTPVLPRCSGAYASTRVLHRIAPNPTRKRAKSEVMLNPFRTRKHVRPALPHKASSCETSP